jgi:PAS domain S-box-containing protein
MPNHDRTGAARLSRPHTIGPAAARQVDSTYGNLQALIAASPLATLCLDLEGRVLLWNPACERMFGWKSDEVVGRILPHVPPSELPEVREILGRVGNGEIVSGMELTRRRKDGGSVQAELYAAPQRDPDGNISAVIEQLADVTGRKQVQEALLQTQKMESVGRLAGGIAHDFNNMLTAISGFAQLLVLDLAPGSPESENAEAILRASHQAAALTRQLLAFSRRQVLEPVVVDPDHSIAEMEPMLRRIIGEDVELQTSLRSAVGHVLADPAQLEQVVLNLAVNARDAMPHGGRLTIETGRASFDSAYASEHFAVEPGDYVMIAVSDSGVGMDTATRAHIFEPFFTTKEFGKGTGLGLATVYGIVRQSGGHIWLYSEPGEGTTFKVYLPLVEEEASAIADRPAEVTGGNETILLVEDESVVRDLARVILERRGYRLLVAATPSEALALIEAHPERIDLLVSDVVMPVLSGPELARQIRGTRPEIKTLFLSGYTERLVGADGRLDGMDGFLSKPFTADGLARKVTDILDASRVASK